MNVTLVQDDMISRYDKLRHLVDYVPAQSYLNVCFNNVQNCCICEKCRRTLMALMCLESITQFKSVFSVAKIAENRDFIIADLIIDYLKGDVFVTEMWQDFNSCITLKHRCLALYKLLYHAVRKIRGGVFVTNFLHLPIW